MPKSRGRQKRRAARYRATPQQPKRRHKASPRWYGPLIISLMAVGVIVIVLNYMGLMPDGETSSVWLWVGLGLLGAGFVGTSFWY